MKPKTLGDHIKKKRFDLELSRRVVAETLDISVDAVKQWETNKVSPNVSLVPRVIEFLGYIPYSDPAGMSSGDKILTCRRLAGLTQAGLASRLGINAGTVAGWENGRSIPRGRYLKAVNSLILCSHIGRNAQ